MGLLDFAKSVGAKILGRADTPAAPSDQFGKEAENHAVDMPPAETKPEPDSAVAAGSAAPAEKADEIAPGSEAPADAAAAGHGIESASEIPESKFYTVQAGDTLWKIAESEYGHGHGSKYQLIFEANTPLLSDPDEIFPGQVLRIPPLAG